MALGSTQSLTEYFLGVKGGRCAGVTTLTPTSYLGASDSWNPQGLSRPVQGLLYFLPYSSPNTMPVIKSRRMKWAGARVERGGAVRVMVGKPEGKRPLGRPGRRWEDNITIDLQEVGCGGMN